MWFRDRVVGNRDALSDALWTVLYRKVPFRFPCLIALASHYSYLVLDLYIQDIYMDSNKKMRRNTKWTII